jgi:hypothetical protein
MTVDFLSVDGRHDTQQNPREKQVEEGEKAEGEIKAGQRATRTIAYS